MTDASKNLADKNLFCKLVFSQAYRCVQMAEDLLVQLSVFNFVSGIFVYNCPAQRLNKSVMEFCSVVRKNLDTWLLAIFRAQFLDNFSARVKNYDEMMHKFIDCLRQSGLKLSAQKIEFRTKNDYLGSTITPRAVWPESAKTTNSRTKSNAYCSETRTTPDWIRKIFSKVQS